jgi:hypothetical protein
MADDRRLDGDATRHRDAPAPPGEDKESFAAASEEMPGDAHSLSKQLHTLSEQLHRRLAEFRKLMGQEEK